jgi:hypothetical protein
MFSDREPQLVDELGVFSLGLVNDSALYQVSTADAAGVRAAVLDFIAKRNIWIDPAQRTVNSLDDKNASKASALGICRVFYRQIAGNIGISNAAKNAIGVKPLNNTKTRRNCTTASPTMNVVASTPGAQTVEFHDSLDPTRRSMAPGATMLQLFVEIGEENAQTFDETKARFVGAFTTNPIPVVFNPADRGLQATYFARWGGKRAEVGQWSLPVSMTIAA